jgi:NADPH2:quinone reductase
MVDVRAISLNRGEVRMLSSGQTTAFNVRDIYLDACVRLQGFEVFRQPRPFARDLRYLGRLVAAGALDPQLASTLPWTDMPAALERLRNREAGGKIAVTLT